MVAAPKHYMPAQMSLAAIIPSAWMSHVSIWLRSVVDLTNSSQCRPIQTFPSPRFPYSNPIFDNPPLIALPAIHWAEIEKKKTNPIATISTAEPFPKLDASAGLYLQNSHHNSIGQFPNERELLRTALRTRQRGGIGEERYLGGVEDLLGLLHGVRLLALLDGYRGPHHRRPSAAPGQGPPRSGRPGRDPGRHGGGGCSGHVLARWAFSSRARSVGRSGEADEERDKKFWRGLVRLGLKSSRGPTKP